MAQQQQSHRQSDDKHNGKHNGVTVAQEKKQRAVVWALAETPLTFPGDDGQPVCPFGCTPTWDDDAVFGPGKGDGAIHGPACPINWARELVAGLICA